MIEASDAINGYFEKINNQLDQAYIVANAARKKGYDPEQKVDIPLARNMAERVEGLMSIVAPQLVGTKLIPRIHQLEKEYGILDWRVALVIAEEVANQKFCKFTDKREAIEVGIRTGFAYHTLGIVAAPLEGFIGLAIKRTREGKEYFSARYAGPIRGAGGTAEAFSVILCDYLRQKNGYAKYDPDSNEVERYVTEIRDYHERATNLQYYPSAEEIRFLIKNIPIEINGDPTETIEVSNYKDLPRVETNTVRGGVCLVIAEGLAQKAPKLLARLSVWGKEFGLEWGFLEEFIRLQKRIKAKETKKDGEQKKITPNFTYISDLVAGRPVLTHPLRNGGFRLRYGRNRVSGYSAASIHPATQYLLNKYIAIGTQLKVERPGKAAAVTACDSIDGPIVKLDDGSVMQVNSVKEARAISKRVEEILYLGDILFCFGDFSENNHLLVPAGYCDEWWVKEFEKQTVNLFGTLDLNKVAELVELSEQEVGLLLESPNRKSTSKQCIDVAKKLDVPLHPKYTYFWNTITPEDLLLLLNWFSELKIIKEKQEIDRFVLPYKEKPKRVLELLGIPHLVATKEFVVIEKEHAQTLVSSLNLDEHTLDEVKEIVTKTKDKPTLEIINQLSSVEVRDKAGTFIGARMGRPEKSKMRKLTGSPQALFPVGEEGGRLRSIQSALEKGTISADFPTFLCENCGIETIFSVCENCGIKTTRAYICRVCGLIKSKECPQHGKAKSFSNRSIDISYYFKKSLETLGVSTYPDLIKGVRGTSNKDHTPEHLIKGILRAKHNIYVNKDGTTRYDMSELPITHFKPKEIGTSVEKLNEMGYEKDIYGKNLKEEDQLLEIKPQDIILPGGRSNPDESADDILFRVANFVDEEMKTLYGLKPFYNLKNERDIVGSLVIGLAPHISAGTVGRIIGFSLTQGCYAHPLWHASLRRDCDGDECCVILLMDALLNFSRQYLPDKRGGRTMDAPLVLTTTVIPAEVDDMVHGMDIVWNYPLDFYEAAASYKYPKEVKIEQLGSRLGTKAQYEGMGFTHSTTNINYGVRCSAYKTLPTMEEKLKGQMELAKKIRAVDETDVATLVIEKHFLKDIKGNLRKFSMQQFRCVKCNGKYRRPPLIGKCTKCGGKIIFTISEGSVVKYLEPSISLANKFDVPPYLKQTLELTKRRIEDVFGKEKEKQEGLGRWFG
ncbi:DNA polymerase II large subunit [Candidatus Woesearchaeota archaeon RBG_13_36_6]|nr:MAG: DNA polymerase II large subunit [Candidatus Woesearchaeota archaeon RBG_13_36_6]